MSFASLRCQFFTTRYPEGRMECYLEHGHDGECELFTLAEVRDLLTLGADPRDEERDLIVAYLNTLADTFISNGDNHDAAVLTLAVDDLTRNRHRENA